MPVLFQPMIKRESMNKSAPFPEFADTETASEDYARRFSGKVGEFFLDLQRRIVLELLAPWPQATILDVGGGHGQLALPLVQKGYQVTVAGSHPSGRKRLDALLPPNSFRFQYCHLLDLPFQDRSFDVVLSFRFLPHLDPWPELIAEMCRVADKAVIIDYPDIRSFNFLSEFLFKAKRAIEGNTRPFRCFRRSEVLAPFIKNRFNQPAFRPEFFVPMAIHRALKNKTFSLVVESISRGLGLTRLLGSPVVLRVLRRKFMESERD
jgi:ubiquinone/menaquinone biosynthesis C-methylase UbiE